MRPRIVMISTNHYRPILTLFHQAFFKLQHIWFWNCLLTSSHQFAKLSQLDLVKNQSFSCLHCFFSNLWSGTKKNFCLAKTIFCLLFCPFWLSWALRTSFLPESNHDIGAKSRGMSSIDNLNCFSDTSVWTWNSLEILTSVFPRKIAFKLSFACKCKERELLRVYSVKTFSWKCLLGPSGHLLPSKHAKDGLVAKQLV